ncbi:interferon-stimulated 20 kDa exonuclease-like 2 [Poecile atricapillus]|uniref:interferon-stimulated 20 kDa exonuclease-like 2 n=1 Tax=Poecile atricapillus TaxID=48891 RepID=UPI002739034C|nr:interferon-stimulated 20 kDa exonuclease-like 2 [Poecile atricapillus]XP_058716454.1 interferon-stimulated 20 kDa exonuclease-like 2 [Poecile atricapillus]XP_058716455.1 interferon-stimulated 20 kDa exonuclease-like 2 [Poecile atricapillus]
MGDLILNLDFSAPESRPKKKPGNPKHQSFVRRRRELERRGVLRQKQLPAAPGGPRRAPGRGRTGGGPGKPRSGRPRSCPKENGPAAAPRGTPDSQNGHTGTARTEGKGRGAARDSAKAVGAPPVSQKGSAGTGAPASSKGKARGAARGTPTAGGAPPAPSKLVAIDCEMVGTGPGGRTSSLARCSIVTYEGDVVYDRYVRPEAPIVDYRTRWSGIRRQHMDGAVPFRRAQQQVLRILAGKVVVGHAIHNDFKALQYSHPKALTRDTAQMPLLNRRAGFPENTAISLKRLTKALLNQDIQVGKSGHSSVEDARATMELYKVVEEEWEQHLLQQNPKQK